MEPLGGCKSLSEGLDTGVSPQQYRADSFRHCSGNVELSRMQQVRQNMLTSQQCISTVTKMSKPPTPTRWRYDALLQLLRASEGVWDASRVFFGRWQLTSSQFNVLNLLYEHPQGCTQIQVSRQLLTHRSNVTGQLPRLESRGLLQRTDHARDIRAYAVKLTARGRRIIEAIRPEHFCAGEQLLAHLSAAEAKQLNVQMERLIAAAKVAQKRFSESSNPKKRRR